MHRSTPVLVAVLAAALAAPPAQADAPNTTQRSTGSAVVGQIGPTRVDAPVRIASDGNDTAADPGYTVADQSSYRSAGSLQATGGRLRVPVRILSRGDSAGDDSPAAEPGGQRVDRSTGAAQAGPIDAAAPVRVLSDGDDAADDSPAAERGGQRVDRSTGAAQAGPIDAAAPVRVLSDGDDAAGAPSPGDGSQATDRSFAVAQLGSQSAEAPVRLASDGDQRGSTEEAGGDQTVTESGEATQVGSTRAEAPVSILSADGNDPDTTRGGGGAEVVEEVTDAGMALLDIPGSILDRGVRAAAAAVRSTTDGTVTGPIAGVVRFLAASTAALPDAVAGAGLARRIRRRSGRYARGGRRPRRLRWDGSHGAAVRRRGAAARRSRAHAGRAARRIGIASADRAVGLVATRGRRLAPGLRAGAPVLALAVQGRLRAPGWG